MAMAAHATHVAPARSGHASRPVDLRPASHEPQRQVALSRRNFKKFEKSLDSDQVSSDLVALLKTPTIFDR
jgi:hypothetical protein